MTFFFFFFFFVISSLERFDPFFGCFLFVFSSFVTTFFPSSLKEKQTTLLASIVSMGLLNGMGTVLGLPPGALEDQNVQEMTQAMMAIKPGDIELYAIYLHEDPYYGCACSRDRRLYIELGKKKETLYSAPKDYYDWYPKSLIDLVEDINNRIEAEVPRHCFLDYVYGSFGGCLPFHCICVAPCILNSNYPREQRAWCEVVLGALEDFKAKNQETYNVDLAIGPPRYSGKVPGKGVTIIKSVDEFPADDLGCCVDFDDACLQRLEVMLSVTNLPEECYPPIQRGIMGMQQGGMGR